MRIKVAAAAPAICPGQPGQNMANVLAAIRRARADGAAMLVLPDGVPMDINRSAVERQAGPMPVYPLTAPSLTAEQLMQPQELDILCCSSDRAATVFSWYENQELAAMASHENMAAVIMACPMGGEGSRLYTGQCVIAQNGMVLANTETGYAIAELTLPWNTVKSPVREDVTSQPTTPWTPFPEDLPRVLMLQSDGLARRMQIRGATKLSLTVGEDVPSLLALCACVGAVDKLQLSRKKIHASVTGCQAAKIAAELGVSQDGGTADLIVSTCDLTARALEGAVPEGYGVNAGVPRGVGRMVLCSYANTCGNRELSIPLRSVINGDEEPWALTDFLLYFSLIYDLPKWALERLLEDTFKARYKALTLQRAQEDFFARFKRPDPQFDGPMLYAKKP